MKQLLILLLCFIAISAIAQNKTIDSLQALLKTVKEDTNRVNTLIELAEDEIDISAYDLGVKYGNEALLLAEKLGFKKGIAEACYEIGSGYESLANYSKAIAYLQKGLAINEGLKDDLSIAKNLNCLGMVFCDMSNNPKALENYQKALKINEKLKNKRGVVNQLNNIANVYKVGMKDYTKAIDYLQQSIKVAEEIGYTRAVAVGEVNLVSIYETLLDYKKALEHGEKSLKIYEQLDDKEGLVDALANIGDVYKMQDSLVKANVFFFKSLKLATEINNSQLIAIVDNEIGEVFQKMNKPKEALKYTNKVLTIATQIGDLDQMQYAYQQLAMIDSALGNFGGAYENHKLYIQYKDSIYNKEKDKKLTQLQMQYEFDKVQDSTKAEQEKKDTQHAMNLQKQKNMVILACVGAGMLLLITLGISFAYRQKQRDNEIISKEKEKSEKLLLNILPAEVAEELKEKGSSEAQHFDEVSVLFTDFVNFTGISETLLPKELVAELHECFTAFDGIIEKNGLEKIKTIGDAYMAVCGLPQEDPLHAQKTVQAALDIRDYIAHRKDNGGLFQIKIGVNSGPLVAGIVGVKKFAYDVWGDTVNTAARMEQNGEAGKVNISGATYELVKNDFACEHRGKVAAKNKGEVDMYFVN